MDAIVLAGGFGTRLRPVVSDVPKPLAPVAGRPFLAWLLDALSRQGAQRVVLSVGYLHDKIVQFIGGSWAGMAVEYVVEEEPLGTGGAICMALRHFGGARAAVLNGDTYLEVDLAAMLVKHGRAGADVTLATVHVQDVARYGGLTLDPDGNVETFLEKGRHGPGWINGGVYIVERQLLDTMDLPKAFSFEREVLQSGRRDAKLHAFKTSGMFIDMGEPADYARAQDLFPRPR